MSETSGSEIPSWVTTEYFVDVVAQKLQIGASCVQISDLRVEPATESGDNFISKLYRVVAEVNGNDGTPLKVPLIVKALSEQGLPEDMIEIFNVFPKEIAMYVDLIPKFEELYRANGVNVRFGPKCLKSSTKPTDIIVLEDLNARDFRMPNRQQGLDCAHVDMFVKKLAQFHAASVVYHEQHGEYCARFQQGVYNEKSLPMLEHRVKGNMDSILRIIRKCWPDGEFYSDVMNDFCINMCNEVVRIVKANPDGFNVLNHGDAWCNNLMYRYAADNNIEEIIFVDFQLCFWSSPVIDLHYFIFTSIDPAFRMSQLKSIISFYHKHLVANLQLLNYKKRLPSLKDLHLDFIDRILFGFTAFFTVLPVCLMEKTADASIDTMMADDEVGHRIREKMYGNSAYVHQLKEFLPYFYDNGTFDCRHSGYQLPSAVFSDYLNLPGWLRKEFFTEVVEQKLRLNRGQYSISKIWVEYVTSKNNKSTLYRANLDVRNNMNSVLNQFSVIIKCRPTRMTANFSDKLNTFGKEIEMFTKIIPAYEKLYEEKGKNVEIGPRYLKICQGVPSDIIVLEDLCSKNFKLAKRQEGVDQKHAESILEKLAEFHAASALYCERHGSYSDAFKEGSYNRSNPSTMEDMFRLAYESGLAVLKTREFAKNYIDDLEKLLPTVFSRVFDNLAVNPEGFNVLNHGDFWVHNVMFQYDSDGHLCNSKLLDFQMCFYGSPTLDLNNFLYTSVKLDIRLSKLNYFIRYYHEKLIENLDLLGYDKALPTLKDLQHDFLDRIVYGSSNIFGTMAIGSLDSNDGINIELMLQDSDEGKEFRKRMYNNERYVQALELLLPYFVERGAFKQQAEICSFVMK